MKHANWTITIHLLIILTIIIVIYGYYLYKNMNEKFSGKQHTITIVVSRYNEDVSWTKQFNNVIIYNKGEKLNDDTYNEILLHNVGREGHTYYTHIYENYYNLSDYTIFLQANTTDHADNIPEKINAYLNDKYLDIDIEFLGRDNYNYKLSGDPMYISIPLMEVYEKLFGEKHADMDLSYNAGALFIVSKNRILKRPREFYLKIVNMLNKELVPIEGHAIERFHKLIFS